MLKIRVCKNQDGMATIEMIPILMLFLLLVNFTLGFFGVIHSGILNSISARNYAFETFRNRSNLTYLRDEASADKMPNYAKSGYRFHSTVSEGKNPNSHWLATARPIMFTELNQGIDSINTDSDHNITIRSMNSSPEGTATSEFFPGTSRTSGDVGVDPVWIMTSYGICLNATCGS